MIRGVPIAKAVSTRIVGRAISDNPIQPEATNRYSTSDAVFLYFQTLFSQTRHGGP
ncbi:hypothetical protein Poly21_52190 [Allorhodopirellula heiligendammensis]|uniref:Uncharacterized protein n=1 Tax=Allorhodopirellula heiligendammensis TaxID=2714739 RepID=A0A5C6BDY3_9BACT|nr:hypothetical protein Poly21_52190 [Allorhodopirellula heiligendammensis]